MSLEETVIQVYINQLNRKLSLAKKVKAKQYSKCLVEQIQMLETILKDIRRARHEFKANQPA